MTVVVTAIFHPVEGAKDRLIAAMQRGIEAVHDEAGCELYAIHDAEDGTVTMIEKWTTAADLEAHSVGNAVAVLNADIDGLLSRPVQVTLMTPIAIGGSAGAL
ncbi:putative quinol monooxygenase [Lysinibacter cavernae]|uniref:Quinol monooxygenase YgiN n=1 Tax=Lysinibacter cavernae TaxID=1640652 RepID=A0A7X5QYW8_9MICO|nr:antibiotic biosynthesis monooxygenase [Lysinibacter cavernae]NIH52489.1 quinol monooxygenase YgiN [Lysinibacter cavernae]